MIVADILNQDKLVSSLGAVLTGAVATDRRVNPSYGYRAVHVIVSVSGKTIEIQVRTQLQHLWAELSEKYSDLQDPSIKYGGGPKGVHGVLENASRVVEGYERAERQFLANVEDVTPEAIAAEAQRILTIDRPILMEWLANAINSLGARTGSSS